MGWLSWCHFHYLNTGRWSQRLCKYMIAHTKICRTHPSQSTKPIVNTGPPRPQSMDVRTVFCTATQNCGWIGFIAASGTFFKPFSTAAAPPPPPAFVDAACLWCCRALECADRCRNCLDNAAKDIFAAFKRKKNTNGFIFFRVFAESYSFSNMRMLTVAVAQLNQWALDFEGNKLRIEQCGFRACVWRTHTVFHAFTPSNNTHIYILFLRFYYSMD